MRPEEGSSIASYVIVACGPSTPAAGTRPQLPHPACTLFTLPALHLHKTPSNGYKMTSSCLYPVLTRQAIRKVEPGVDRAWLAIQEQFHGSRASVLSESCLFTALIKCFFHRLLSCNWIHRLRLALLMPLLHIPVMTTPSIIFKAMAAILA